MTRPVLLRFANADELGVAAYQHFLNACRKALAQRGRFTVAIPGGRGPLPLFAALRDHGQSLDWEKIRIYWVDERWVPSQSADSNFGVAKRTFLGPLKALASARPFDTSLASPAAGAKAYAELLQAEFAPGLPVFDLCILGMGPDGHTASLFPGTAALNAEGQLCVATRQPASGQDRVTLTFPVLNASEDVLFLVQGAEKEAMLQMVFNEKGGGSPPPAARVTGDACTWMVSP